MGLQRNNRIWDFFSRFFGLQWFYGGEILLCYGVHHIRIHTKSPIKRVWLSMRDPENCTPVCCGDISLISAKPKDHYVAIDADIKSEIVIVNYFFE